MYGSWLLKQNPWPSCLIWGSSKSWDRSLLKKDWTENPQDILVFFPDFFLDMDLQFLNTQFVSPINAFNLRLMYCCSMWGGCLFNISVQNLCDPPALHVLGYDGNIKWRKNQKHNLHQRSSSNSCLVFFCELTACINNRECYVFFSLFLKKLEGVCCRKVFPI